MGAVFKICREPFAAAASGTGRKGKLAYFGPEIGKFGRLPDVEQRLAINVTQGVMRYLLSPAQQVGGMIV